MSADTMPCGCEGHFDNEHLCRYPALEEKVKTATGQLRHAYGNHHKTGQAIDPGLVAQAIRILETALGGGR